MRVLVGCEHSGVVRDAFIRRGHDAWSCDLLPSDSDFGPHLQCDVMDVLDWGWDLAVFHPTCTYLTHSALSILYDEPDTTRYVNSLVGDERFEAFIQAATFFTELLGCPIPRIAVENPYPHHYARKFIGIPYSQIIQPWQYGHGETKRTCLWLKGLPLLVPTDVVGGRKGRVWKESPGPDRWKRRSRFYQGWADAMADQWGSMAP